MTLGEIELSLYDKLAFAAIPDSAVTRRMRGYINRTHRKILSMKPFARYRRAILTATSVANSPFMVLPQAVVHIVVIADRTNSYPLDEISIQELRYRDPGLSGQSGTPNAYAIIGLAAAVAKDPSAAASLWVVSDSAADGTGISASVEGTVTGGYYRKATLALNGVTAVNIGSTITTWEHITKFYVSAVAQGSITLLQTSGVGTELARIAPQHTSARYTQVHLSPTPATAITYYCDVELHIEDMIASNDEPLIHEDFHWLLECGALKLEYQKREKTALWKIEDAEWRQGLSDFKAFVSRKGGVGHGGPRGNHSYRFSQFSGPNSGGI